MSRVGKHVVSVPKDVKVNLADQVLTIAKGNENETYTVPGCLSVQLTDGGIKFTPLNEEKATKALWGTTQRNVDNIVKGMVTPFQVSLKLSGVGYKASVKGKQLVLQLGYSHDVVFDIPEGVSITCSDPTSVVLSGSSKKKVGDAAAVIRSFRKPEPYKGKGVIRQGEFVYRKEGKKK